MGNELVLPRSPSNHNSNHIADFHQLRANYVKQKSQNDLHVHSPSSPSKAMISTLNSQHDLNNSVAHYSDDLFSDPTLHTSLANRRISEVGLNRPAPPIHQFASAALRQKNTSNSNPKLSRAKKLPLSTQQQLSSLADLRDHSQQQHQHNHHQQQQQQHLQSQPVEEVQQLHIYFKRNPKSNTFTTLKFKHIPYRLRNLIVDLEDELFLTKREVESLKIFYLNVERDEKIQVKHDLDLVCIRQLCRKFHMVQMFVEVDQPRSSSFGNLIGMNQGSVDKESNKYRKIRELGRGAFGIVSLVIDQRGIPIAEKKIRIANGGILKQNKLQKIELEINLLESLDHPHIVQYYGTRRDENYLYILLEYMPCGSIGDLLKKMHKFDEELISSYLRQTLIGLQYLHSKGVIHRDIKPDNLLLTSLGEVKVADFGCSTIVEMHKKLTTFPSLSVTPPSPTNFREDDPPSPSTRHEEIFGTPAFLAPEVVSKNEYSFACDVWAVGCMGIMLYSGEVPWSTVCKERGFVTAEQLMIYIGQGHKPALPEGISPVFEDFLNSCLQLDPEKRSSVNALIKHKFIVGDYFLTRRASIFDRKMSIDTDLDEIESDDDDSPSDSSYGTYLSTFDTTNYASIESSVETRVSRTTICIKSSSRH